ncbi:MAG: hypothetical protein ACYC6L_18385 [Anaerolineae bacterium]
MSQITLHAFLSVPPCSGGVALKRVLARATQEFGSAIEVITHVGRDEAWTEYHITNAPGLVVGDLVKFVGVTPDYECLVGALREAGLE